MTKLLQITLIVVNITSVGAESVCFLDSTYYNGIIFVNILHEIKNIMNNGLDSIREWNGQY